MFGVVPRVVWERVCPPDELNRIRLTCNCLFIDTGKEKILVETGIGEKWTDKQIGMYGIESDRPFSASLFEIAGCLPEDISIVINTHLHFDHAGGNTVSEPSASPGRIDIGETQRLEQSVTPAGFAPPANAGGSHLRPQFRNARYLVSRSEFNHAESPHERDRASYLPENWHPLVDSGQIDLMPDEYEPVEGLKVQQVRGHSETMQTVKLERDGETLFGFFDLVPTRHHLALPWIMGYDLFPAETLEFKRLILPQAVNKNWICHFYHDTKMPLGRLVEIDDKIRAVVVES